MRRWLVVLCALLPFAAAAGQAGPSAKRIQTEKVVGESLDRLGLTPGLALGVHAGGRICIQRGFGLSNLEDRIAWTKDTPTYIASTTKSFFATALAVLDHRDKLRLDAPISGLAPEARLPQPLRADRLALRDLIVHRSGIENPVLEYLRHDARQPAKRFDPWQHARSCSKSFRYSNLNYLMAGDVVEAALQRSWSDVIRDEVLRPLGMNATAFSFHGAAADTMARPYLATASGFRSLPAAKKPDHAMTPAGGMVSSLRDLMRWLEVWMDGGRIDGKRVLPEAVVRACLSPQIAVRSSYWNIFQREAYGLGWYLGGYRGHRLFHCFGNYAGYRTHVSFMPDRGIGVVAVANEGRDGTFVPDLIAQYAYDVFLGREDADREHTNRIRQHLELVRGRFRAGRDTTDYALPQPLARDVESSRYVGRFVHDDYGAIQVSERGGSLHVMVGRFASYATCSDGQLVCDPFPGSWTPLRLRVETGEERRVTALTARLDGDQVVFRRQ